MISLEEIKDVLRNPWTPLKGVIRHPQKAMDALQQCCNKYPLLDTYTNKRKNMENHVFGFFMKNIVFHIYLGIVEYTYTV